jgi:hypothetical protein
MFATQQLETAMATKTKKPVAKKSAAKKAPAKKAAAAKRPVRKTVAKKVVAKKAPAKKALAKKLSAKKAPAKKTPAKKIATRSAPRRAVSRGMEAAAAPAAAALPADFFSAYTGATLSDADYATAAQALGCEVAAIKAVADVESKESPFDAQLRPTILYERHIFARNTVPKGKFNASNPDLSANSAYGPGGYGLKSAQYGKLARAYALDADAALKAPSWGKFQILGENHKACGYATVLEFVKAMTTSEREHLRAFAQFVAANPAMHQALRAKNWAAFAQRYNGPDYKKYNYDEKMKAAYLRFAA